MLAEVAVDLQVAELAVLVVLVVAVAVQVEVHLLLRVLLAQQILVEVAVVDLVEPHLEDSLKAVLVVQELL
jgi:hypothetical protein